MRQSGLPRLLSDRLPVAQAILENSRKAGLTLLAFLLVVVGLPLVDAGADTPGLGVSLIVDPSGAVRPGEAVTYTVTLDVAAQVASLTVGAGSGTQTLAIAGQTLTLDGASSVGANGILTMTSGLLTGAGDLTIDGQAQLYVMGLRRYKLEAEVPGMRIVSRWVVETLDPKG